MFCSLGFTFLEEAKCNISFYHLSPVMVYFSYVSNMEKSVLSYSNPFIGNYFSDRHMDHSHSLKKFKKSFAFNPHINKTSILTIHPT